MSVFEQPSPPGGGRVLGALVLGVGPLGLTGIVRRPGGTPTRPARTGQLEPLWWRSASGWHRIGTMSREHPGSTNHDGSPRPDHGLDRLLRRVGTAALGRVRQVLGARVPGPGRNHGATQVRHWYGTAQLQRGRHGGLVARGAGLGLVDGGRDGQWTSPVSRLGTTFAEAIVSWNILAPGNSWAMIEFRALHEDGTWTPWFTVANWGQHLEFTDAAGRTVRRSSVPADQQPAEQQSNGQQPDGQGRGGSMQTDTFVADPDARLVGHQVRVQLHGSDGTVPELHGITVMTSGDLPAFTPAITASTTADRAPAFTSAPRVELEVPTLAQHVHDGEYPEFGGGGQVWCSPTSVSMVLGYWGPQHLPSVTMLDQVEAPNGDPIVPFAARGTWDAAYGGCGNWVFNTAFAHQFGLRAFVTRLAGLDEAEAFLRQGIPLVASVAFEKDQMPEAGYRTDGHLLVIVGITQDGDVIVNDPARQRNDQVRSTYRRANFERAWQQSCHGIVYVLHPAAIGLPDGAGLHRSW